MSKLFGLFLAISFVLFSISTTHAFTFAVFGDNQEGEAVFKDVIKDINKDKNIDFAINCGDLTVTGKLAQYKRYLDVVSDLNVKLYNVIGNHDIIGAGRNHFIKYIGQTYYSWDYENCHFVVLDNVTQYGLEHKQTKWLKNDLLKNEKPVVFVFMHKPMSDPTGSFSEYLMGSQNELTELKKIFRNSNVKYVICGHIHGYGKIQEDGITYIVTGGAGGHLHLPNFAGGFFNYVKIKVDGNMINDQVIRLYPE